MILDPIVGVPLPGPKKPRGRYADYQRAYYWQNIEKCRKWRREPQARYRAKKRQSA